MLETTAWTESDSRTIQFLVPTVSFLLVFIINLFTGSSAIWLNGSIRWG